MYQDTHRVVFSRLHSLLIWSERGICYRQSLSFKNCTFQIIHLLRKLVHTSLKVKLDSFVLTYSSLSDNPGHSDEEHHTPDIQHAADLQHTHTHMVTVVGTSIYTKMGGESHN